MINSFSRVPSVGLSLSRKLASINDKIIELGAIKLKPIIESVAEKDEPLTEDLINKLIKSG